MFLSFFVILNCVKEFAYWRLFSILLFFSETNIRPPCPLRFKVSLVKRKFLNFRIILSGPDDFSSYCLSEKFQKKISAETLGSVVFNLWGLGACGVKIKGQR